MLDRPAAKTAAAAALVSLGSLAFSRRYPQSRILVALPILQAGLQMLKATQRADQVRKLRSRGKRGLLDKAKKLR